MSAASPVSPAGPGRGAAPRPLRRLRPPLPGRWAGIDGAVVASRTLAVLALVALVGMLPWLSSNDPALTILRATSAEREATPEVLDAIRERLGLRSGPAGSIGHWLGGLLHGDPGVSWISGGSVGPETLDAFGVSLVLMGASLAVSLLTAVLLTLPALMDGLAGRRRSRGGALAAALTSLPEYLLAPLLLLVLSVYLGWLPPYGWGGPEQIVLPALSLGLPGGGLLGGLLSDAVAAVFAERWVVTWTTAGIGGSRLALAVLRRALTPLTGQIALVVVGLTGGAVAVEKVFAIPGIGRALLGSATAQDVPASQYTTTEGQNPTVSFTAEGLTALKGQPNAAVTVTFTATVDQVPATGQIPNTGYFNVDTRTVPGEPDQPDDGKKVPTNEVVTGWGDLKVLKADADKADTGLKGAKFKVYASSDPFAATCDASTKTGDPIAVNDVTEFESDASGVVNIEGLFVDSKVGQKYNVGDPKPTTSLDHTARCYVLEEVQAPAGFVLPTGDQALTAVKVNAGQTVGTDVIISNAKQGVPGLPLTGAAGKVLMMLGGSALVLLGVGTALVVRSRRRHG